MEDVPDEDYDNDDNEDDNVHEDNYNLRFVSYILKICLQNVKKLNSLVSEQWRNEVLQLLHNEEMNLYNCCAIKKCNYTNVDNWRNYIVHIFIEQ